MQRDQNVAIFWDYETAQVKSRASGYAVAKALRDIAHSYGVVRSFRAYLDVASQSSPGDFFTLRREIHSSGVSIVDCPSVSRKDVADKAMIVDMFTLAMDEAAGCTILIATGDRDLAYALSVLRFRGCRIILACPPKTDESLLKQADDTFNWNTQILGIENSAPASCSSSTSSSSSKHTLSSYLSYAAPPLPNNVTGRSNQARSRASRVPSAQPPPSPPHLSRRMHGNQKNTNVDNAAPELGSVLDGTNIHHALSSSALSPVSSVHGISPTPRVPNLPNRVHNACSARPPHSPIRAASVPVSHPRQRTRSNTVSSEWFFPPAPSFPLETRPSAISIEGKHTTTGDPSPPSSEAFSVVDRPNPTTGPSLSSLTAELLAPPHLPTPGSPKNSKVSIPAGSSSLSTTPAQVPQVVAPLPPTGDYHHVTSDTTTVHPSTPTPGPATEILPNIPVKPVTVLQGSSQIKDRAVASAIDTPKTLPATAKPAPLAAASVTIRPTQTKASNPTAQTHLAAGPPKAVPKIYHTLVERLQHHRQRGVTWPNSSCVASELMKQDPTVYKSAGVKKWSLFARKAENDGIITIMGEKVSLKEEWWSAVISASK